MAFPTLKSVTRYTGNSTFDFPALGEFGFELAFPTIVAGDYVVVLMTLGTGGRNIMTYPAELVILSNVSNGSDVQQLVFSAENVAGAFASFGFGFDGAHSYAVHIYVFSGVSAVSGSTAATGDSTTPNPPNCNPAGGAADTTFITAASVDGTVTVSSYPTNYTANGISDNPGGGGGSMSSSYREVNADSDDPGTFTMSASEQWVAYTYALVGMAGGGAGPILRQPRAAFQHMMMR